MQIPSIPPPILTNTLPQDLVAKAVPTVQATPPLLQRAVDPSPKSEKFNQTRSKKDNPRGQNRQTGENAGEEADDDAKRGSSVNISV